MKESQQLTCGHYLTGINTEGEPSTKAFAKPYQPEMPLPFETEFEDDGLAEVPDKTVAEEKEWEEQQEALAEQAADAEEEEA
eukprot:SAG31_NODE_3983_length_3688_cov_5.820006_4_plen_82_part_00